MKFLPPKVWHVYEIRQVCFLDIFHRNVIRYVEKSVEYTLIRYVVSHFEMKDICVWTAPQSVYVMD